MVVCCIRNTSQGQNGSDISQFMQHLLPVEMAPKQRTFNSSNGKLAFPLTWLGVAAHELLLLLLLLLLRHLLLLRVLLLAIVLQMGGCHRLLLLLLLLLGGCCGRCCGMDGQQLRFRGLVRTHCDLRGTHGYGRGWHHQGRHGQHYLRVNFGR